MSAPIGGIPYLTDREKQILETLLDCWADQDHPLAGDLSYQDAIDLMKKLEVEPARLLQRLADLERAAQVRTQRRTYW